MELLDDCECIESGECTCEQDACICYCECVGCSQEIVSDCACGGNCSCQDDTLDDISWL